MRAPGHLERPLPTALAALRIEIEFPVIPQVGTRIRPHIPILVFELQGLITHQERHGTYPYRVYALGVIIEGHFQHLLRLDSVTVTALGKL